MYVDAVGMLRKKNHVAGSPFNIVAKLFFTCKNLYFVNDEVWGGRVSEVMVCYVLIGQCPSMICFFYISFPAEKLNKDSKDLRIFFEEKGNKFRE